MSYILEALKKAEQKRRHGNVPDLGSSPSPTPPQGPRRPILAYIIVGALIINLVLILALMRPWERGKALNQKTLPSATQATQKTAATMPAAPPAPAPSQPAAPQPATPQAGAPQGAPTPEQILPPGAVPVTAPGGPAPAAPPQAAPPAQPVGAPGTAPSAAQPAAAPPVAPAVQPLQAAAVTPVESGIAEAETPQPGRLYAFDELPPDVRNGVPDIVIGDHMFFGDPASGFITINDQMLRPGDMAAPGLKLEQLTWDGPVFSYRGFRFILPYSE